jgi:hypothetical protein
MSLIPSDRMERALLLVTDDHEAEAIEADRTLAIARSEAARRRTSRPEVLRAWRGEDHETDYDDHDTEDDASDPVITIQTELLRQGRASEITTPPIALRCPACFTAFNGYHSDDCKLPRAVRQLAKNRWPHVTIDDVHQEPHHHRVCHACNRTQAEWQEHNTTCRFCGAKHVRPQPLDYHI